MRDDFRPETEPSGALDPPSRKPPAAVGTGEPKPGAEDPRFAIARTSVSTATPNTFGRFLARAFDILDEMADTVANALHIRPPDSRI